MHAAVSELFTEQQSTTRCLLWTGPRATNMAPSLHSSTCTTLVQGDDSWLCHGSVPNTSTRGIMLDIASLLSADAWRRRESFAPQTFVNSVIRRSYILLQHRNSGMLHKHNRRGGRVTSHPCHDISRPCRPHEQPTSTYGWILVPQAEPENRLLIRHAHVRWSFSPQWSSGLAGCWLLALDAVRLVSCRRRLHPFRRRAGCAGCACARCRGAATDEMLLLAMAAW